MTLSMAGIAVSLLTVVLVVSTGGFHVHPDNFTAAGNNTLDDVRDALSRLQRRNMHLRLMGLMRDIFCSYCSK